MNKKILFPVGIVILVGATVYMTTNANKKPTAGIKTTEKNIENKTEALKPRPVAKAEQMLEKMSSPKQETKNYTVKEQIVAGSQYETVDIEDMKNILPNKKRVDPIGAYKLKPGTIKDLFKGDKLILADVAGMDYELTIETRKKEPNGIVTLGASIDGEVGKTLSVLTEGETLSFMTLNTPYGIYEFEAVNGNGYIYSAADIKNEMISYTHSDGVVPPSKK